MSAKRMDDADMSAIKWTTFKETVPGTAVDVIVTALLDHIDYLTNELAEADERRAEVMLAVRAAKLPSGDVPDAEEASWQWGQS